MFPPGATVANGGQLSGDTVQAACGRAALPANALLTGEGLGIVDTILNGAPPADGGNQAAGSLGMPFGSAAGGGGDAKAAAGGINMNVNVGAVGDVVIGNQVNPVNLTYNGGGNQPMQFAG